ncbi:uncharacterized protein N7483_011894 [Penicillium malachiteum]|uniref:uncharacterized protein n=1 Tax=Penicillium malachiteum TaxID=1324776 RepID=UPI0025473291|nr:uncharacterized protein N7483_011894 [Penicillium malachiteum]KAJ5714713.1 hypothetical protein N7483_011894 [Penicillium malachiteum]
MIESENCDVRVTIFAIFYYQQLEEETINALVAQMIKDPSSLVQDLIISTISSHDLSSTTIDALVSQMIETVDNFKCPAIGALQNCKLLPDRAINALVRRITNETEIDSRSLAGWLFREQSLPDEALDVMIALITTSRLLSIREAALFAIRNRTLPDWAVDALILTMTREPDENVNDAAWLVIAYIPHLSDKAFEAICHLITNDSQRYYLLEYLLQIPLPPGSALKPERVLVSSLDKTQDWENEFPISMLGGYTCLPQDAIEAFLYQLEEREPSDAAKRAIVGALRKHSIQSLFTSSRVLRIAYQNLTQNYNWSTFSSYIQDGLVYFISSGVKKKFSPAMDAEEIKLVLFEEAARLGNPLVNYFYRERRQEDLGSL